MRGTVSATLNANTAADAALWYYGGHGLSIKIEIIRRLEEGEARANNFRDAIMPQSAKMTQEAIFEVFDD
jgi:hypothetical protein